MSLPVGMCYRTNGKNNTLCHDKITGHPKIDFACIYATSLPWMHDVVYTMHTTWNYSDTGRGMPDMSFLLLPVRFRGIPRLLHLKTIYIAPRRVLVSFYAYIINICRLCKKNDINKWKYIFLTFLGFRGGLGRPTVLGIAAFTAVDFAAFVECALLPTCRGQLPDCSRTSTSFCKYVTHSCF